MTFLTQDKRFANPSNAPKTPWGNVYFVPGAKLPEEHGHRFLKSTQSCIATGEAYLKRAKHLAANGLDIDLICAHSGWGTGSFMPSVWPKSAFVQYLEWWYTFPARDVPDNSSKDPGLRSAYAMVRNLPFLLDAQASDRVLVPTHFQAAEQPKMIKDKLTVLHDGVDTEIFSPGAPEKWTPASIGIPENAPVLTYATRGMEPVRGFPDFMAALSRVQAADKDVHCVIAGTDTTHYSAKASSGKTWKDIALEKHQFDTDRLHFVGRLPFLQYRDLLRASTVHVSLTEPFVLSWSVIQSMAAGCAMVVSDNGSVREALPTSDMATHVDHSDHDQLSSAILNLLTDPVKRKALSEAARLRALDTYDERQLLQQKEALFLSLIAQRRAAQIDV